MHVDVNDIGARLKAVFGSSSLSFGLGGTSTHLAEDKVGAQVIDRLAYGRRYKGALVVVGADLTFESSAVVTVSVGLQDGAATSAGSFADFGSRTVTTFGTAVSSDSAPTFGVAQASVNIQGARRYIRPVMQIATFASATSSGQTVAPRMVVVLGGADEDPST